MKFLDYLFHGKELRYIDSYFKMLNGYSPTFTSYNGGVYEMDLTRTAVNSFATHCSKLKPEIEGSALKSLEKTLQHKPNYFMDTTKFIKRLATYVAVEHTAFIIPIEDEYSAALAKDTIFAFLFNFKDYVLNTNYSMGVKKYEDNDTDDQITKGIMLVDGKVVDKNSLVVVKKIEAV
jgi:hypothetical protein